MEGAFRACALVPVFNHGATVGAVVRGALAHVERVLVVDDGSTDGTAAALAAVEGPGVEVLRHGRNLGKGAALLTGFRRAAELGFTHAVVIDADGQHLPADIPRFLEGARARPMAILLGERRLAGSGAPRSSSVGRWVSNFWTLRTTGFDLPDTQCGFRAYPVAAVLALPLRRTRYDFEVEVLVRGAWAGLDLVSVPVGVHYPRPEERVSHFRALSDNVRISSAYTWLALRRLLPTRALWRAAREGNRPGVRWRETLRVIRDLGRGGTRPAELGLAVGTGVFIGSTPLWGLHGILSIYVCGRLHLNAIAAFAGSNVSLPFLVPFLIYASVQCGHLLLRGSPLPADFDPFRIRENSLYYLVGSLPVALVLGLLSGALTTGVALLLRGREGGPRPLFSLCVYAWMGGLLALYLLLAVLLLPFTLVFDRRRRTAARLGAFMVRTSLRIPRRWRGAIGVLAGLDLSRPAVVVLNHRSIGDIALALAIPGGPRLCAKPWVGRIPLMRPAMEAAGHVLFDPADPGEVRDALERMEGMLRAGTSVVFFPEGTRQEGEDLGPFEAGAFHVAVRAGADVLPVLLLRTGELVPRGRLMFHDVTVGVRLLPRMAPGGDRSALSARVREEMLRGLGRG